jgi:hypothetical protein
LKIADTPEFLESIANDPRIFPYISCKGQERIDLSGVWHKCIGFEFDGGGWVADRLDANRYEVHTLFLPKSPNVRENAQIAFRYLFCNVDALEVVTKVPDDLPHALKLALDVGFTVKFKRDNAWHRDTHSVGMTYLSLTVDEWAINSQAMQDLGHEFHEELGEHQTHDEDPIHDRYVGLGVACALAGQPEKGVWLYNKWARFAGYQEMDFSDGVARFDNTEVFVNDNGLQVKVCQ